MRTVELDAASWKTGIDFYNAVLGAVGAPPEHGLNVNALLDSMVWDGMNTLRPPYTIRIVGAANLSKDIRDEIELVKRALAKARVDFQALRGRDVDIKFETDP